MDGVGLGSLVVGCIPGLLPDKDRAPTHPSVQLEVYRTIIQFVRLDNSRGFVFELLSDQHGRACGD